MSNPISFSSSLIPVPSGLLKSSLHTGLADSRLKALTVSYLGVCRDFSRIDDPRSITFEDAQWANHARQHRNYLPTLAIINAFRDQILGRVSQLWTVHCDRGRLVRSSLIGIVRALLPINGQHSSGRFYDLAIAEIDRMLASSHKSVVEKAYLSQDHETLRNSVHGQVTALRLARCRDPELATALNLEIPYLRVVQLLSLAGPATPDGPMPASDAKNIASALALWQTRGDRMWATD